MTAVMQSSSAWLASLAAMLASSAASRPDRRMAPRRRCPCCALLGCAPRRPGPARHRCATSMSLIEGRARGRRRRGRRPERGQVLGVVVADRAQHLLGRSVRVGHRRLHAREQRALGGDRCGEVFGHMRHEWLLLWRFASSRRSRQPPHRRPRQRSQPRRRSGILAATVPMTAAPVRVRAAQDCHAGTALVKPSAVSSSIACKSGRADRLSSRNTSTTGSSRRGHDVRIRRKACCQLGPRRRIRAREPGARAPARGARLRSSPQPATTSRTSPSPRRAGAASSASSSTPTVGSTSTRSPT